MKALLLAAVTLLATPAAFAANDALVSPRGNWQRVLPPAMENAVGRSITLDRSSVAPGGLGRSFRELDVLTADRGGLARGTMQFMIRSVDCQRGLVRMEKWRLIAPSGVTISGSATPGPAQRVRWTAEDGIVIRTICQGVRSR